MYHQVDQVAIGFTYHCQRCSVCRGQLGSTSSRDVAHSAQDALLAYEQGASGILISNHGGRQLDTTRPSLDVLLEIRKHAPQLFRPQFRGPLGLQQAAIDHPSSLTPPDPSGETEARPFEVYVDGGIYRGTDVVKALCLGANAVGVGRGFLFAQSVAGVEGVEHAVGSTYKNLKMRDETHAVHSPPARDTIGNASAWGQQAGRFAAEHGGDAEIDCGGLGYISCHLIR
jgi:hypothetical protein